MLYSRPCCLSRAHTLDFVSTLSFCITFFGFSYLTTCPFLKTFELLTPALDLPAFSLALLLLFMFSDSPYLKNTKYLFSGPCRSLELPSDSHVLLYHLWSHFGILHYVPPRPVLCKENTHIKKFDSKSNSNTY